MELSEQLKQTLDALKRQFPHGLSVLMPALHAVQAEHGHIPPELEEPLGAYLGIAEIVHEVSTFYFMFNRPVGHHHDPICGNLSCWLRGAETLRDHLAARLGIQPGETTPAAGSPCRWSDTSAYATTHRSCYWTAIPSGPDG